MENFIKKYTNPNKTNIYVVVFLAIKYLTEKNGVVAKLQLCKQQKYEQRKILPLATTTKSPKNKFNLFSNSKQTFLGNKGDTQP